MSARRAPGVEAAALQFRRTLPHTLCSGHISSGFRSRAPCTGSTRVNGLRGPQPIGNDSLAIVGEHFDHRAIDDDAEADAAIDRANGPRVPAWIMRERCSTRAPAIHEDLER